MFHFHFQWHFTIGDATQCNKTETNLSTAFTLCRKPFNMGTLNLRLSWTSFIVLSCHSWLLRNVLKLTNFFNHFSTAVWHWKIIQVKSFSLTVPMQCSLRVLSGTVPVLLQSAWGVPGLRQPQAAWSYASPANLIQWSAREWIPPCPWRNKCTSNTHHKPLEVWRKNWERNSDS